MWQTIKGNLPSKSNNYLISGNRLYKHPNLKAFESSFYIQCDKYRHTTVEGEFELEVKVFYPSRRSDLDNGLKILLDCLQKMGVIENDNKCMKITASKHIDKTDPRIEFALWKPNNN
jgi:Holliday junction resolvase RusA-like endonuclease